MGIFNRLFTSNTESAHHGLNWTQLTDQSQLDELFSLSSRKKVLIFKHSTRCGISRMVLKQFEQKFHADENTVLYFLDLLRYRDISNAIAQRFNVRHQSPQVLVIENGTCSTHASHYGIVELVQK